MRDPVAKKTRAQCLAAMISAAFVALCVCIGVTMNLVTIYDENFDHMGIRTFSMFTVDSNILMGIGMLLVLPYTVDGLRTGHYHLPNWIVDFLFVGVTGVALTFLVSLFILSPVKGFGLIFGGSRFFLHGVCPVISIVAFCVFICDHYIRVRETFWTLLPVFVYSMVYVTMVMVIGNWQDFYGFLTRLPAWVPILLILPITFGIATLIRLFHNRCCLQRRKRDAKLYRDLYQDADLRKLVGEMARSRKKNVLVADVLIPARTIGHIIRNSENELDIEEACRIYLDAFLNEGKGEDIG